MIMQRIELGGITIEIPPGWSDVTPSLDGSNCPFTIADANSDGALQFSIALYKSGKFPEISLSQLSQMLTEFSTNQELGLPFDEMECNDAIMMVGQSFQKDEDFLRVWYCADGANIALITYLCEWSKRFHDKKTLDGIVGSVRFEKRGK